MTHGVDTYQRTSTSFTGTSDAGGGYDMQCAPGCACGVGMCVCGSCVPYFIFMSRPSDLGAEARLVLTGCVPVCVIRLKVLVLRKRMGASSE